MKYILNKKIEFNYKKMIDNNISRENLILPHTEKEWYEIFSDPKFDEEYYYSGNDLGFTYTKENTIIKLWAPTSSKVILQLYNDGNPEIERNPYEEIEMKYTNKGIFEIKLNGDYHNKYYTYKINVNGKINITNDPYSKSCGVNGIRSYIFDNKLTNPENFENSNHVFHDLNEIIIYELHIIDFSNSETSNSKKEYKGKYLAFTENNTYLNNDKNKPTCLKYLEELGITSIQFQPIYDFGSINEDISKVKDDNLNYNWGYDPINYNSPEGSYSTNSNNGLNRIKELKLMIQNIHKSNISIIMDVVYNHTYYFDNSNFNLCVPYYYYRQDPNNNFILTNGSGCGNDTSSERKMFKKFILDSLLYWVNEYKIDGFRFDLMGLFDINLMNEIRNTLDNNIINGNNIIIYGEPWSCSKSLFSIKNYNGKFANKSNLHLLNDRIGFFHDSLRDSLKGSVFEKYEKGFISGIDFEEKNILDNKNQNDKFDGYENFDKKVEMYFIGKVGKELIEDTISPINLINYMSCHDNNTLWDKLVNSVVIKEIYLKKIEEEEKTKEESKKLKEEEEEKEEKKLEEEKIENKTEEELLEEKKKKIEEERIKLEKEKEEFEFTKKYYLEKNPKLVKMNKLGASMIIFSFGIPLFLAGEEGGRTKLGIDNSYNTPKNINEINYERIYQFEDLLEYYKKIIFLRKKLSNIYVLNKINYFVLPHLPKGIIGFHLKKKKDGEFKEIYLIFNSSENDFYFKIPSKGKWVILLSKDDLNLKREDNLNLNNLKEINGLDEFLVENISCGIIGKKD